MAEPVVAAAEAGAGAGVGADAGTASGSAGRTVTEETVTVEFGGDRDGRAPLTWGQRAIWHAIRRTAPNDHYFNIGRVLPLADRGRPATVAEAVRALGGLMGRHEALRTRLEAPGGRPGRRRGRAHRRGPAARRHRQAPCHPRPRPGPGGRRTHGPRPPGPALRHPVRLHLRMAGTGRPGGGRGPGHPRRPGPLPPGGGRPRSRGSRPGPAPPGPPGLGRSPARRHPSGPGP